MNANSEKECISQPLLTLGEACIHAARHSHSLILTKWINGSLPVFGYFHAHYLFSASLVLAMSSFVPIGSPTDLGAFETGLEVLASMSENGNLAASEFYHNLKHVKQCLDTYRAERRGNDARRRVAATVSPGLSGSNQLPFGTSVPLTAPATALMGSSPGQTQGPVHAPVNGLMNRYTTQPNPNPGQGPKISQGQQQEDPPARDLAGGFTTAMAFMEPTMQDFLAQSDLDLGLLYPVETFMDDTENLYSGHEFT